MMSHQQALIHIKHKLAYGGELATQPHEAHQTQPEHLFLFGQDGAKSP